MPGFIKKCAVQMFSTNIYIYIHCIYRVQTTGELGGARLPLIRHGLP